MRLPSLRGTVSIALMIAALSACGGSSGSSPTTTDTTPSGASSRPSRRGGVPSGWRTPAPGAGGGGLGPSPGTADSPPWGGSGGAPPSAPAGGPSVDFTSQDTSYSARVVSPVGTAVQIDSP